MISHEYSLRFRIDACFARRVAVFAAMMIFAAATESVQASIVGPKAPEFSLESSPSGASSDNTSKPIPRSNELASEESDHELELSLLSAQHGPNSTSSTSGSPLGTGASASMALICSPAGILSDPAVAGWVSGERQVSLPSLRCNELLRPPQMRM